jgi:hypothetical protein
LDPNVPNLNTAIQEQLGLTLDSQKMKVDFYRVNYRKDSAGRWKISRLEYDTLSRADYRSGKSYAQPISVSRLATRFPADQQGPDELL